MGNTKFDAAWSLQEAIVFVQGLVHSLEIRGFAVGLTGSVLTKGSSMHDLDIIVYPLQSTPTTDINDAKNALKAAGMMCHLGAETLKEVWRRKGSLDEKEVEVWRFKEKRVDVFFLK
jgi:hypothetical protein